MVNRMSDFIVPMPLNTVDTTTEVTTSAPTSSNPALKDTSEEVQLSAEKAKLMTESMNHFMESMNTNLRFQYHEELQEYYVTIVDSKTDEVVKEIPSKKLMDIYAAMRDFLGVLVDHKI